MEARHCLGLDIGGTRCKLGRVDLATGSVCHAEIFFTEKSDNIAFYQKIWAGLDRQIRLARQESISLAGLGVGIGAYVFADGILDSTWGFIPFLDGQPLAARLSGLCGLPCQAANDTECAARAEAAYGAGRGHRRSLTITLGTGVGVGLIVDGQPPGHEPYIHMAGHVMAGDGGALGQSLPPCYCAVPGCLERACSGTALNQLAKDLSTDSAGLFGLAAQGRPLALERVHWFLDRMACGLNQYAYLYGPEVIVLGGGVAGSLAPWMDRLRKSLSARVHERHRPQLALAALGDMAGVIGAGTLLAAT